MEHIIVVFHPFEMEQEVMVYQHGECVKLVRPHLEDIAKTICNFNNQYHPDRIEMCGNPSFVTKYIKELKSNFSELPEIEIIPR